MRITAEILTMAQKEVINTLEIKESLEEACSKQVPVIASFTDKGKWQLLELKVTDFSDDYIVLDAQVPCNHLKSEQSIGICIHLGYYKYLFDTCVHSIHQHGYVWSIQLEMPDRVERIQRRMYYRQSVPPTMNVKVLFWHRGYLIDSDSKPEELYWQGRLLNLSAGGAQFELESEQKSHFKVGQLLGVQFTPMSYQKPLLLESHVRYLEEQPDKDFFKIGVEFLGLEASSDGREILDRILEVIGQYEEMNKQDYPANSEEIKH